MLRFQELSFILPRELEKGNGMIKHSKILPRNQLRKEIPVKSKKSRLSIEFWSKYPGGRPRIEPNKCAPKNLCDLEVFETKNSKPNSNCRVLEHVPSGFEA